MHHMRFLGLVWSVAACCSLTATAAHARVADRPISLLDPLDGFCCRYGLGQWQGCPHRYVSGDAVHRGAVDRAGEDASPTTTAAPLPLVVDEARAAVGARATRRDFYDEVDGSNFDCPQVREPSPSATEEIGHGATSKAADDTPQNHPVCRGEEPCDTEPFCEMPADGECPLRSLEESLADWRHSAGQWVVQHLNAQSDGLDETEAGELDWAAIASQMEGNEAPVGTKGPTDGAERAGEGNRESKEEEDAEGKDGDWFGPRRRDPNSVPPVQPPQGDDDTYQGPYHRWEDRSDGDGAATNPWEAGEASREPGRLRQWCGQAWDALRSAARDITRGLEWLSEGVTAAPTTLGDQDPSDVARPQTKATRPPLPDYFLPAFGSPWDGDL